MKSAAELWNTVYASFEYHRKPNDENAQAALDRVAMKCLELKERKPFNPDNCSISERVLSVDELNQLVVYHSRDRPIKMEGPIVVLVFKGRAYVIEGNTRTIAWRMGKYKGPFVAIFLEPKDKQG